MAVASTLVWYVWVYLFVVVPPVTSVTPAHAGTVSNSTMTSASSVDSTVRFCVLVVFLRFSVLRDFP